MKYGFSFAVVFAIYLACTQPCTAAESPAPAQMNIEDLRARLALTPDQQAQMAPLVEERKAKMAGIRSKLSAATSRRDKRSVLQEAKVIQDDFNSKVEPVLTQEQQAEWKKIREESREQMKERLRNR